MLPLSHSLFLSLFFLRTVAPSFAFLSTPLLFGCETLTSPVGTINIADNGNDGIYLNSNRRAAYVLTAPDPNGNDKTRLFLVSEPPPDTALNSTVQSLSKISADIAKQTCSAEAKMDVTQTVTQIARAMSVSILRDTLFRLSEAYANGAVDKTGYKDLHARVVEAVTALATREVERTNAQAQVEQAKADQENARAKGRALDLLEKIQAETNDSKRQQLLEGFEALRLRGDGARSR